MLDDFLHDAVHDAAIEHCTTVVDPGDAIVSICEPMPEPGPMVRIVDAIETQLLEEDYEFINPFELPIIPVRPAPSDDLHDLSVPLGHRRFTRWLLRFNYGLGIAIMFSALIMLFGLGGCTSMANTPWRSGTDLLPQPVLEQMVSEHSSPGLDIPAIVKGMTAWVLPGNRDTRLAIFNFRTPALCGSAGCEFVGYRLTEGQSPVEVLDEYLDPRLPKGQPLFEGGDRLEGQALPCLVAWQLTDQEGQLKRSQYCPVGDRYQVSGSQLVQKTKPQAS